jgi:DNA-binding MarR family transcriptional regulator
VLTREGESVHARIAPIALASEERLLSALDAKERAQLDALIDRLLDSAKSL